MNKVILSGRLAKDPTIREAKGFKVAEFALAVERPYKSSGGDRKTDFIECTSFGRRADFAEKYMRKGIKVMVSGYWMIERWKNREGNTMISNKCVVEEVEFCGTKAENAAALDRPLSAPKSEAMPDEMPSQQSSFEDFIKVPDNLDDEIPFA